MKRNIRVHDQTKRGAGGWVVFFGVTDIPYQKGFEHNGQSSYAGRVGMDLPTYRQARQSATALKAIPNSDWNYDNAWTIGMAAQVQPRSMQNILSGDYLSPQRSLEQSTGNPVLMSSKSEIEERRPYD